MWAAAITALELLFGKKPFEGLEYKEMIGRLRTKIVSVFFTDFDPAEGNIVQDAGFGALEPNIGC